MFSVDFLSAACDEISRKSTIKLHNTSHIVGIMVYITWKLTLWAAQDGLFDHITAWHTLLKALRALFQEPLSCHHFQLPANMTSTTNDVTHLQCLL